MNSPHYSDTCQCRNCRSVRAARLDVYVLPRESAPEPLNPAQYFACDPCECGGHPECPVCGIETEVRQREAANDRTVQTDR
jgi:hypothetical protein